MVNPINAWWVQIEGLPQRWSLGELSDLAFREDLDDIAQTPDSISDSVDPITAELNLSSFSFNLNANDEAVKTLLYQQVRPVALLDQPMTDVSTVLFADGPLGVSTGDTLFVGMESMRVINTIGTDEATVFRGEYGTRAAAYPAGVPVNTRLPRMRGRRVELYSREGSTTRLRWTGFVDTVMRPGDGTRVRLMCRNVWTSAIATSSGRQGARAVTATARIYEADDDSRRPIIRGTATMRPAPFNPSTADQSFYAQFGDALVAMRVLGDAGNGNGEVFCEFDSRPLLGSTIEDYEPGETYSAELRPVFVVSPVADRQYRSDRDFATTVGGRAVGPSVLDEVDSLFSAHPFQLALFLLTGGYIDLTTDDLIYADWATDYTLSFRDLLSDAFGEQVADLIRETPELSIDHLVLGWDGEEFDVVDVVIEKLLRPFGAFFGLDQSGRPTIRRFGPMSVLDISNAEADGRVIEPLPGPWLGEFDPSLENSVDVVTAEVGGLPWTTPTVITVDAVGAGSGRTRVGDGGRWKLDYSTLSETRFFDVAEDLVRKSTLAAFSFPRFRVRVPDTDQDDLYDIGGVVRVSTLPVDGPYLIDGFGELVEDLETDPEVRLQFYGIVIARTFFPSSRTYELVVMLTSWRTEPIRLRAPSAMISANAVSPFLVIDLEEAVFTDDDVASFVEFVGGVVPSNVLLSIYRPDLQPVFENVGVEEFLTATNQIEFQTSVDGARGGDIVRLGTYDASYKLPETGLVLYNFLAGADDELSGDPAHEYS